MDKLIEDRTEEKRTALKQKLEKQLKAIRERRISGVNYEPFPDEAFERLKSHGIWEQVLGYLTEPSDFTSAYFACGTFAKVLEKRRLLMLMPKALEAMRIYTDQAFEQNDFDLFDLRNSVSLKCREVSKAWKAAADYQLFDFYFSKDDWYLTPDMENTFIFEMKSNACKLEDEESINKVVALFSQPAASQCLIRNLHVRLHSDEPEPLFRRIIEFLQRHAGSVWYFHFEWNRDQQIAAVYGWLREMLRYLPNVKGFLLDFAAYGTPLTIRNLRKILTKNPFPVLKSLEHFKASEGNDEFLISHILEKCVNLKSVNIMDCEKLSNELVEALMPLTLERYDGPASLLTHTHVTWTWPLKYLRITSMTEGESVPVSELFPGLNRLHKTLQHLHFDIFAKLNVDDRNVRLDLPQLKVLRMSCFGIGNCGMMGIDDVILLKGLEKLTVNVSSVDNESVDSKVKVKGYFNQGKMEKSNVWSCFPYLKRLKIGGKFFYRSA